LIKIVSIRIILSFALFILAACANQPERWTNKGSGPLSAGARNEIARNSPEGLVRVGEGFERSGNYTNALNLYDQALANDPTLIAAKLAKGRVLSRGSRRPEGIAILNQLILEAPDNREAVIALTQAYSFAQDYTKAYSTIEPLAHSGEADQTLLNLAGTLAQVLGNPVEANLFYDRALQINPGNSDILSKLAISFALEREYESAIAVLQPLLNNSRGSQSAAKTLANIYALSGQIEAANAIIRSAGDPTEAKKQEKFHTLLSNMNRNEQAIALLFNVVPISVLERENENIDK
jgi:tetratricopeptide (TPR) repeat protein